MFYFKEFGVAILSCAHTQTHTERHTRAHTLTHTYTHTKAHQKNLVCSRKISFHWILFIYLYKLWTDAYYDIESWMKPLKWL